LVFEITNLYKKKLLCYKQLLSYYISLFIFLYLVFLSLFASFSSSFTKKLELGDSSNDLPAGRPKRKRKRRE